MAGHTDESNNKISYAMNAGSTMERTGTPILAPTECVCIVSTNDCAVDQ